MKLHCPEKLIKTTAASFFAPLEYSKATRKPLTCFVNSKWHLSLLIFSACTSQNERYSNVVQWFLRRLLKAPTLVLGDFMLFLTLSTLTSQIQSRSGTNRVVQPLKDIFECVQVDLIDYPKLKGANSGYQYILVRSLHILCYRQNNLFFSLRLILVL